MQKSQLLVFGLLFALPSCSQGSGGAQYDGDALSALYAGISYPTAFDDPSFSYSYVLMNWMDGEPCTNSWDGVVCYDGRVDSLNLKEKSLHGTLPTELGLMDYAWGLRFDTNLLYGSIPTEIGKLESLQYFDLDSNSFEGSLPTELGMLSSISTFYANSNSFSCGVPSELSGRLYTNYFTFSTGVQNPPCGSAHASPPPPKKKNQKKIFFCFSFLGSEFS